MPIVGEQTYLVIHDHGGNPGPVDRTHELNMAPSNVFAKVALFEAIGDGDWHILRIKSIKHKRSDGIIEQVDINSNAGIRSTNDKYYSVYLPPGRRMTFGGILILEYWG